MPPRGVKSQKRKRQYKKVLSSIKREGRYRGRQKQVAARIVNKTRRKKGEKPERSRADTASWEGVDRELFDALRGLRRELAEQRQVPPYVIFSDATLRELARYRPSTLEAMRLIYGVGEAKLREHGQAFLDVILRHGQSRGAMRRTRPMLRSTSAPTTAGC